jgi:hypothetical protein
MNPEETERTFKKPSSLSVFLVGFKGPRLEWGGDRNAPPPAPSEVTQDPPSLARAGSGRDLPPDPTHAGRSFLGAAAVTPAGRTAGVGRGTIAATFCLLRLSVLSRQPGG